MEDETSEQLGHYLCMASAEGVYRKYESRAEFRKTVYDSFGNSLFRPYSRYPEVPEWSEQELLSRNNPLIDLALAAWCENPATSSGLFARYAQVGDAARVGTGASRYKQDILKLISANFMGPLYPWAQDDKALEEIHRIFGDESLEKITQAFHSNPSLGRGLLKSIAAGDRLHSMLQPEQWMRCFHALLLNPRVRFSSDDYRVNYKIQEIHADILEAVSKAPRLKGAAESIIGLLTHFPSAVFSEVTLEQEARSCANSWRRPDDVSDADSVSLYTKQDHIGISAADELRFTLMRRYAEDSSLDVNHQDPDVRLVAYARLRVCRSTDSKLANCLTIESLDEYLRTDGRAFLFASSFNPYIWGDAYVRNRFPSADEGAVSEFIALNRAATREEAERLGIETLQSSVLKSESPTGTPASVVDLDGRIAAVQEGSFIYYRRLLVAVVVSAVVLALMIVFEL